MERELEPGQSTTQDGIISTTIVVTVKVTPFFDLAEGFVYNVQSVAMIVSPICMALGGYLAFSAYASIVQSEEMWEEDTDVYGRAGRLSLDILDTAGSDWGQAGVSSASSSAGCRRIAAERTGALQGHR